MSPSAPITRPCSASQRVASAAALLLALALLCPLCVAYDFESINVLGLTDGGGQLAMQDTTLAYALEAPDTSVAITYVTSTPTLVSDVVNLVYDFATISSALSNAQAASYPTIQYFPIVTHALVPIYRLDALGTTIQLILSRSTLALIYLGQITWWNDSRLQGDNGLVVLPAQRITVVLPQPGASNTFVWTMALSKFNANFTQSIAISMSPAWPTQLYYNSYIGLGSTGQASQVLAHDGSIGYSYQSVALEMGSAQALMINKAGNVVQADVQSVTFAAVELGTQLRSRTTALMDLTDATGSSVWPIAMATFLMIDTVNSRSTCSVRQAMVEFWLWFYTSSVAAGLLAERAYAPVPSIVLSELDVLDQLRTRIMCRGAVALPPATTTSRVMGAFSVSFVSSLFANLYLDVQPDLVWSVQNNRDELILRQLVDAEIDLAFINMGNVPADLVSGVLADPDFLVLPTYLYAPSLGYNPQLSASVNIAGYTMTLDSGTAVMLIANCIKNWNDPRILAQNPWLAKLVPDMATTPMPITKVYGCGSSENWPLLHELATSLGGYSLRSGDYTGITCFNNVSLTLLTALATCTPAPSLNQILVPVEASVPPLMLGLPGSLGAIQASGSSAYGVIVLSDYRHGVPVNTTASVAGMSACALDTFDASLLSSGQALTLSAGSRNLSCYAPTQQVVAVLRNKYSSTATDTTNCGRGYDALQFMQWFYNEASIDPLIQAVDEVRVSALLPSALSAYKAALQSVTCDGETLLVTEAVQWKLTSGISSFVAALCAMGEVGCLVLCVMVATYRQHPIIRSASPLFLLLSVGGVALMFGSGFALVAPVSTSSCSTFSWLLNFGLCLCFAPLFAKTWRIYRIFGRKKLSVVAISNRKLLSMVGVLVLAELALMAAWQAVGNLQPIASYQTTSDRVVLSVSTDTTRFIVDEYVQCGVPAGGGKTLFVVVLVEKGLLFVFGALMAFTTRKVKSTFNESSGITLAIYNVCFTVGIIAPIILVINAEGDVLTLLLSFALLWIAYFTGGVLFTPKLLQIFSKTSDDAQNSSIIGSASSSSGYVFMSLAALVTLPALQGYHAALQKHLAAVEARMRTMPNRTSTAGKAGGRVSAHTGSVSGLQSPAPLTGAAAAKSLQEGGMSLKGKPSASNEAEATPPPQHSRQSSISTWASGRTEVHALPQSTPEERATAPH